MRLTLAFAALILASVQAASGQTPLTLAGAIELPGVEGEAFGVREVMEHDVASRSATSRADR